MILPEQNPSPFTDDYYINVKVARRCKNCCKNVLQ